MAKHKPWRDYPERVCRWLNECVICAKAIKAGQLYFDGGYSRRAHRDCVILEEREAIICAEGEPPAGPGEEEKHG